MAGTLGWRKLGVGPRVLDTETRALTHKDGRDVALTTAEFMLMTVSLERPRFVLSRDQLLDLTSGRAADVFDRTIGNQVSRLRKRIEDDPAYPRFISTIRSGGYGFTADVREMTWCARAACVRSSPCLSFAFVAAQVLSLWPFADEHGAAVGAARRIGTAGRALALSEAEPRTRDACWLWQALSWCGSATTQRPSSPRMRWPCYLFATGWPARTAGARAVPGSPHDGAPANPRAAFAWMHDRMRRAGIAPVELRLSLPITAVGWPNVAARFTDPGLHVPPR